MEFPIAYSDAEVSLGSLDAGDCFRVYKGLTIQGGSYPLHRSKNLEVGSNAGF